MSVANLSPQIDDGQTGSGYDSNMVVCTFSQQQKGRDSMSAATVQACLIPHFCWSRAFQSFSLAWPSNKDPTSCVCPPVHTLCTLTGDLPRLSNTSYQSICSPSSIHATHQIACVSDPLSCLFSEDLSMPQHAKFVCSINLY
eukprot:scaffold126293_cov16-Tisochrysis_lutea.AAC.2